MRSITAITALLVIAMLSSCDERTPITAAPSIDPFLTVEGLEIDTLYLGETGILRGASFGRDVSKLKLFCRTAAFPIVEARDSILYFSVPSNAESGMLRLYKNDFAATGDLFITIIPHPDGMNVKTNAFLPLSGSEGESFVISGKNLDLRRRDVSVRIGKTELTIDSLTRYGLYSTIPNGIKDDSVFVRIDKAERRLGLFRAQTQGADQLFNGSKPSSMKLRMNLPVEIEQRENGVVQTTDPQTWIVDSIYHQFSGPVQISAGGFSYSGVSTIGSDTCWVSFDLVRHQGGAEVSGSVAMTISRIYGQERSKLELQFEFDHATCRYLPGGIAYLSASGSKDSDQIRLTRYLDTSVLGSRIGTFELKRNWPFIPQEDGDPFITFEVDR